MDLSQLLARVPLELSRMLQTFVGPLELGLLAGGILGLALPARGPAGGKKELTIVGLVVFLILPIALALGLTLGRDAYCHRPWRGAFADPVYDYLVLLSLTAAFGVGRVIRGRRPASILTALALLFGAGWLVATFSMMGMCGPAR